MCVYGTIQTVKGERQMIYLLFIGVFSIWGLILFPQNAFLNPTKVQNHGWDFMLLL